MNFDRALGKVGTSHKFSGDITKLNVLGPRPPDAIELMLGYRPGRLARGYYVLLLTEPFGLADIDAFEFSGTTLRSGGRAGLPLATPAADRMRSHVSDQLRQDVGSQSYRKLKENFIRNAQYVGSERLAKIFPVEGHDDNFSPKIEYPMGGGAGQWTIPQDRPREFLIAMHVSPDLQATTARFTVSLAPSQPYLQLFDARARIAQYLAGASGQR